MAELTGAARRRIDAAMLESLATSFKMHADGMPLTISFNTLDVADMLERAAKIVSPRPVAALSEPVGEPE